MIFRRNSDGPPHVGRKLVLRAALAGLLVIAMSATAVATTGILEVDRIKNIVVQGRQVVTSPRSPRRTPAARARCCCSAPTSATPTRSRGPQAALGHDPARPRSTRTRSAIAVHVDPARPQGRRSPATASDKINAAFEDGGPRLTVRTIKKLFSDATGKQFPINNVINVNFGGFRRAVNYIGGVYVDVDRRYFNDNTRRPSTTRRSTSSPATRSSRARTRSTTSATATATTTSSAPRASRTSCARSRNRTACASCSTSASASSWRASSAATSRSTRASRQTKDDLLAAAGSGLFLAGSTRRSTRSASPHTTRRTRRSTRDCTSTPTSSDRPCDEFMNAKGSATPRRPSKPTKADQGASRAQGASATSRAAVTGPRAARARGREPGRARRPASSSFPFYFPTLRYTRLALRRHRRRASTRSATSSGKQHRAYRLVVSKGVVGEYYGVQGMTWQRPADPRRPGRACAIVNGRKLRLYYDGSPAAARRVADQARPSTGSPTRSPSR